MIVCAILFHLKVDLKFFLILELNILMILKLYQKIDLIIKQNLQGVSFLENL